MNMKQAICLGLGMMALVYFWLHQIVISHNLDLPFLVIVSVMAGLLIGGFVFTFRDGGGK